jgi:hypothetical protein
MLQVSSTYNLVGTWDAVDHIVPSNLLKKEKLPIIVTELFNDFEDEDEVKLINAPIGQPYSFNDPEVEMDTENLCK